jgi:hypothetical protein
VSTESLTNSVLVSIKGKVAKEEGVRRRVLVVAILLSTALSTFLWCGIVTGSGEVDIGFTAINECTLLGLESCGSIGRVDELDVSETLGATSGLVADDTSTRDLSELLELTVQPLVINVPAQVTNEQVLGSSILTILSLGLLCGSSRLLVCFALLGWRFGLALVRVAGVRSGLFFLIAGIG